MSDPLQALHDLRQSMRARIQRTRRTAEVLVAQAETLEMAECELDIAIDKAAKALAAAVEML